MMKVNMHLMGRSKQSIGISNWQNSGTVCFVFVLFVGSKTMQMSAGRWSLVMIFWPDSSVQIWWCEKHFSHKKRELDGQQEMEKRCLSFGCGLLSSDWLQDNKWPWKEQKPKTGVTNGSHSFGWMEMQLNKQAQFAKKNRNIKQVSSIC